MPRPEEVLKLRRTRLQGHQLGSPAVGDNSTTWTPPTDLHRKNATSKSNARKV